MAAMYMGNHLLDVKAIAALTESGMTPLWMSRISSGIPIFALTRHQQTRRKVTLYRGVYPISFSMENFDDHAELNQEVIDELKRQGVVRDSDVVIITKGDLERKGSTNALKIVRVGELVTPRKNDESLT
jgi:pyruvate kinase